MRPQISRGAVLLVAVLGIACNDYQSTEPSVPSTVTNRSPAPTTMSSPMLVQLGREIFFDEALSVNDNQSCASCHAPEAGWTGPTSAVNAGPAIYEGSITGRFGNRKPPSSAYATQSPIFHRAGRGGNALFVGGNFWDGRATGERLGNPAADQALGPFLNPVEQALDAPADVVETICAGAYATLFLNVWGADACDAANVDRSYDQVGLAIAAFEASDESNAFSSKFDYWRAGLAEFTREERRGFNLFKGKAKCIKCHTIDKAQPVFTDYTFDNLGVPRNRDNPWYGMTAFNPEGAAWIDAGLGGFLESRLDYAEYADESEGMHKVPTLRNVDLRPSASFVKAYGHNGYFKSLEGIVHFYNTRDVKPACADPLATEAEAIAQNCWPAPEVSENVNTRELGNLRLTSDQEAALVAFLKTLSDGYTP